MVPSLGNKASPNHSTPSELFHEQNQDGPTNDVQDATGKT